MASISKRGKTWQAKVYFYDEDGKRHAKSKTGFHTKREAEIYATDLQKNSNDGQLSVKGSTPLPDYLIILNVFSALA